MQDHPPERPLHGPPLRQWLEALLIRILGDDLDVDAVRGPALDDRPLVSGIHPRLDHARVPGGQLVDQFRPPVVSCTLAAVTITTNNNPRVSVTICRLVPLIFFPASIP